MDEPTLPTRRERLLARRTLTRALRAGALAAPALALYLAVERAWEPISKADTLATRALTVKPTARELQTWRVLADVLHPHTHRLLVLLASTHAWKHGNRREAVWATTTMATGGLLGAGVKQVVQRARPFHEEPVAVARGYSFPSLHAMNSALGWGILLTLLEPEGDGARRGAAAGAAAIVVVTSYDRLALGVHHLSDILAGWSFAATILAGARPPRRR